MGLVESIKDCRSRDDRELQLGSRGDLTAVLVGTEAGSRMDKLLVSSRESCTMAVSRLWDFSEVGEAGVEAAVDCNETEDTSEHTEASELTLVMLIILEGLDITGKTGAGGKGKAVDLGFEDTDDMVIVEDGREDTTEDDDLEDFTSADSVLVSLNDVLV